MKEIKLEIQIVFHNNMTVMVQDFPGGDGPDGKARTRCKISVEFAESDVKKILADGKDFHGVMEYYKNWLYETVKVNLACDWECIAGYKAVMTEIENHVRLYC